MVDSVWSRGKDGDYIKVLPIAIKVTGASIQKGLRHLFVEFLIQQTVQIRIRTPTMNKLFIKYEVKNR
jgi:hypothetical protein